MDIDQERAAKIAVLNDEYRREEPMRYVFTRRVQAEVSMLRAMIAVANDDVFTEDNDPYGEHDFGRVIVDGETLFWKIDYYDMYLECHRDPLDVACRRVLTVMFASEY